MSYCRLVNSGSWASTAAATAPKALKMNPVKVLHSKFYEKPRLRSEIDYSMARFRITVLLEALQSLPSCYVVDFANRPAACKCMKDPALTPEMVHEAADFLRGFALLKKEQQQAMIVEWMKYASLSKERLLGHSMDNQRRIWLLPGTTFSICRNALQRIIGYGSKAWKNCEHMSRNNIAPAGRHGLAGRTGVDANKSNPVFHEQLSFFFNNIQDLCTPRATRLVREFAGATELRDDEDELVELPPYLTKSGLYKRFVNDCGYEIYHDAKHRVTGTLAITGKEQKSFPSERTFIEFWSSKYPQIVPQKVREDICGDCYTFSNSHRFITGVLAREEKEKQDERRDAEEDDASTTSTRRDRAAATFDATDEEMTRLVDKQETLVEEAAHHVMMAKKQRDFFRDKKEQAVCDRLAGKPLHERTVTWVADYAQNVSVPNFAGEQPGDTYYYSPCNAYVFGIADCTIKPTTLTAHVALEDMGKKGGNNVASMLWQQLVKEGFVPTPDAVATHKPIKELNLFFDNCGGQNKNRMVFRLLFYIVKRRVAARASAIFLVRGHTKNDCDRIFNLMKRDYRNMNTYTPKMMYEALNQSPQVTALPVDSFQDWDALQDKHLKRLQSGTTNCNHCFTVDAARDSNKIWLSEYHGAEKETCQTLVKTKYLADDECWWQHSPTDIEHVGLQYIKWQELFKFWKKFVPEEHHKDWKYYAEDLPAEEKDKLSKQKEESRKKRQERGRAQQTKKKSTATPGDSDAAIV